MRPTIEEHQELNKLRENRILLAFFERSLAEEKDTLVTMVDMDKFRHLQGGTRRLRDLLDLIMTDVKSAVKPPSGKR